MDKAALETLIATRREKLVSVLKDKSRQSGKAGHHAMIIAAAKLEELDAISNFLSQVKGEG